jgi:hypothetical protein
MASPTISNPRLSGAPSRVGTLAAIDGLSIEPGDEAGYGVVRQTRITYTNVAFAITDLGSTGCFGAKVYTFPKAAITVLAAVQKLTVSATAGSTFDIAHGTTLNAAATLATTEVDITPASSTHATNANSVRTAAPANFNGTSTETEINLNGITSGDPGAGAVATINGTLIVSWINSGNLA